MSRLSFRLAKAAAAGRTCWPPVSREQVLARLLRKRAAAHRAGLVALESSLRHQIAWSLPMRSGEIGASPDHAKSPVHATAPVRAKAAVDHRI